MSTWITKWGTTWRRVPHLQFALLSIVASVATVSLKFAAYHVTGSVGLLSDAVESTANVIAALTALFALWYASFPADRSHPYGHEKIEFFASGIEGGLILSAALVIAWTAVRRFVEPALPEALGLGFLLVIVSTTINFAVGRALLTTGRRADSIVLEADGHHLLADVWTSIGVLAGLLLVHWTKQAWLDAVIALLVAMNIVRIASDLVRRSFNGLMDRALDEAEIARIRAAIEGAMEAGMTYHALRTRRAGARRFADFHLLVPGECSVTAAHDTEMAIGRAIEQAVPGTEVTTHIEPIEEPLAWNDYSIAEEAAVRPDVTTAPS